MPKRKRGQRVNWDNVGFCRRASSVHADLRFLREQIRMANEHRGIVADESDVHIEALERLRKKYLKNGLG